MGGGKGSSASMPEVTPVEIPAPLPTSVDEGVQKAGEDQRRRYAAAKGHNAGVLTGASGLYTPAKTDKKNLLGG